MLWPMQTVAILTGDLIASTARPEAVRPTMAVLEAVAHAAASWSPLPTRFTRFRGDGWQFCLPAGQSLRAALLVAARLRVAEALPTRLAIGIGTLDFAGTRDLSDAAGSALTASGRALDHMARGQGWTIAGTVQPWQVAMVALAEWHSARWSREQAEAVAAMLEEPELTQLKAAERLEITRQAWQARLSGAGYGAWRPALAAFESAFDD